MIRAREGGRSKKDPIGGNQNILVSSKFHCYEPTSLSMKVPVVVFENTTTIDFDSINACIISIDKKIMFLMTKNYNYYVIQIVDSFIKYVDSYKFIILADNTIYSGKEDSNDGVQVPLYLSQG